MIQDIVQSQEPITVVGAGALQGGDLAEARDIAPRVVAADGGAKAVLAAGLMPEAVIGDFDSLDAETRAALAPELLHLVTEQNSTDFEKALARIAAPLVIGAGFTGARVDHTLAVLHGLMAYCHRPCVLLAEREVIVHLPPRLELELSAGTNVSLFPMAPSPARQSANADPRCALRPAP